MPPGAVPRAGGVVTRPEAATPPPEVHFGKILVDDVLGNEQVKRIITAAPARDLEQARAEVAAGRAAAVIYVPGGLTADLLAGKSARVGILTDPGQPTQAEIVTQVARAFTESITASILAGRTPGAADLTPLRPDLKEVPAGTRSVSAMQYYAAAMAAMFMVMTAFSRARDLLAEREAGTLPRLLVSPTSKAQVLAGQVLGTVAILMGQFLILMGGTRLLFGVDWGPTTPALLIGTAFALAASGIGTGAAGVLNNPRAADAGIGLAGNLFGALSGAMFPLWAFGDSMRAVAKFIPNYWMLQSFYDQMAGVGPAVPWTALTVLLSIGMAFGALGAWRLAAK